VCEKPRVRYFNVYIIFGSETIECSAEQLCFLGISRRVEPVVTYLLVIDRVAGEIIRLVASVCVRVCRFVCGRSPV